MDKAHPFRLGPPFISFLVGLFPRVGFEYPFHWSLSLTFLPSRQHPPVALRSLIRGWPNDAGPRPGSRWNHCQGPATPKGLQSLKDSPFQVGGHSRPAMLFALILGLLARRGLVLNHRPLELSKYTIIWNIALPAGKRAWSL